MINKTLISIVGPTAIGKTSLAIGLAKLYGTEIISADSRQFYKEMHIGTAVPSEEELKEAKHHFIQNKSIHDTYTVGDFEKEALATLKELFKNHDVVIMVGGSGLYVDAIILGLDHFPDVPLEVRNSLNNLFREKGITPLQEELKEKDPEYYLQVDLENPVRLIRAIGVCRVSGQPYSSFLNNEKIVRDFKTITIGIQAPRDIVYERINNRVDIMIQDGLVKEVDKLLPYKNLNALKTVGYTELFSFLENECTLEEAIEKIKMNTRRFAKRQGTWFKKNPSITWVNYNHALEESQRLLCKLIKN
jgi:tRNA dimethylallyltransferase